MNPYTLSQIASTVPLPLSQDPVQQNLVRNSDGHTVIHTGLSTAVYVTHCCNVLPPVLDLLKEAKQLVLAECSPHLDRVLGKIEGAIRLADNITLP